MTAAQTNYKKKPKSINYKIFTTESPFLQQQDILFKELFVEEHEKSDLFNILTSLSDTIVSGLQQIHAGFQTEMFYNLLYSIIDDNEILSEDLSVKIITKLIIVFGRERLPLFCRPLFCDLLGKNLLQLNDKKLELSIIRLLSLLVQNSPENADVCKKTCPFIFSLLENMHEIKDILIIGNFLLQLSKSEIDSIPKSVVYYFLQSDEPNIKSIGIELVKEFIEQENQEAAKEFIPMLHTLLEQDSNEIVLSTLKLIHSMILKRYFDDFHMVSPFLQSKFSITREQSAQCIISLFEINQSLAVDNDYLSFLLTISSRGSFSMKTRLLYCICLLISNKCVISPSTELYAKCAKQILDIFSTEEFDIFEPALKSLCLIFTEFSSSISISDVLGDFDFSQFDTYLETEEARGDLVEALEGMLPEKENEDERLDLNSI